MNHRLLKLAVLGLFPLLMSPSYGDSLGSAAGGTAANQSSLGGGIYLSSPPTLTSGQQAGLQFDANGNLRTTGGGSSGTTSIVGNVASGGADSGNPVKVGCVFNTTFPTVTNGQRVDCQADVRGGVFVGIKSAGGTSVANVTTTLTDAFSNVAAALNSFSFGAVYNNSTWDRVRSITGIDGTGLGVAAVEQGGGAFSNITSAATTTVKSGAGVFHKLCINTYSATATITMYNSTTATGTKIGTITNPATLIAEGPNCAVFDVYFSLGLTIVTTGTQDITVVYR